jgi:hypothetical protein
MPQSVGIIESGCLHVIDVDTDLLATSEWVTVYGETGPAGALCTHCGCEGSGWDCDGCGAALTYG